MAVSMIRQNTVPLAPDQGAPRIEDAVGQSDQHRCRGQHAQQPQRPEAILQQGPGQQNYHKVGQQVGHAAMGQRPGEQRQEEVTVERLDGAVDRQFSLHRQDRGRHGRQRVAHRYRRIEFDPGQGGTWAVEAGGKTYVDMRPPSWGIAPQGILGEIARRFVPIQAAWTERPTVAAR
jgi:hypothetical protein